jgi:hypothetical protein
MGRPQLEVKYISILMLVHFTIPQFSQITGLFCGSTSD